jgi:hypothetical protein
LLLLTILFLVLSINDSGHLAGLGFMILDMMLIAAQVATNLLIALVYFFAKKDKPMAQNYFVSMLVVAIVGASTCFGCAEVCF